MSRQLPKYHPARDPAALDKLTRRATTSSYMNDTKWRRLLDALTAVDGLVLCCKAKLLWSDSVERFWVGDRNDYYADSVEAMITGPSDAGFHYYREIEWIEFPPEAEELIDPNNEKSGTKMIPQDLDRIRRVIDATGKFELDTVDGGLRLYAYRRTIESTSP